MNIPIIYEDEHILALNKPAGISVHGDGRTKEETIAGWILEKYPDLALVGEPMEGENGTIVRPGIVHRLDKETSGVLVIAKTKETYAFLKRQFADRKIAKTYRAFTYGVPAEPRGIIAQPIGRSSSDFKKHATGRHARGELRDATTIYKVLAHGEDNKEGSSAPDTFSYLELFPKTGRTHQIRVHLSAIQNPIVCDKLYAPKRRCALGFKRLALHAFSLEISLPFSGGKLLLQAPLPDDFVVAMKRLSL